MLYLYNSSLIVFMITATKQSLFSIWKMKKKHACYVFYHRTHFTVALFAISYKVTICNTGYCYQLGFIAYLHDSYVILNIMVY